MPDTAIFDHYEVLTRDDGSLFELGRGAMGITYKAFDTSLRIPVALKVINAAYLNSEVARQRFIREARSAAQLRHRNVASVFHLGTEGDTWFYAMEFIDGETLDDLIKRQGPLSPVVALNITGQVARALNAAAQHGLVHRDIKPSNLMLVKEDDDLVAKVIDFGLAKASVPGEEDAATLSMGGFVGTPHFASPEQLEEKEIDSRSDIYSLGVTLWYMLAGKAPFAGSMAQVMSQHLTKPPPFEKLENLPASVAEILRKMLAKDPGDRYQKPADLRKAVESALETLASSGAASSTAPITSPADGPEDLATLLEGTATRAGLGSFETNTTIANRYQVARSCGETNTGQVFRAYDSQRKAEVRLIVLHPEALTDTAALTALEHEVEKLLPIQHPNLLGVYGFETVDRGSFLVLEWTEGFTLLDLLKARRELDADETLKLLQQAAEGADFAIGKELTGLEFGLHQIQIHFPEPIEREKLLRAPIGTWPAFSLKLYPLGATREMGASKTWAGAQTMVACSDRSNAPGADARAQYVQALAAVVYELLGGSLSPLALRGAGSPAARYTPLSTLSEEGNDVLRQALDCGRSYPSVHDFSTALAKLDGLQVRRHESKHPVAPPPLARATPPPPSSASASASTAPSTVPFTPSRPRSTPIGLIAGLAAAFVAVLGVGYYFFVQIKPKPQDLGGSSTQIASTGNPATTTSDTPASAAPAPAENPPAATPAPSIPVAATPIPATPIPSPTRQDMLKSAVLTAQEFDEKTDWPKALDAWLAIAKDYSDFPVGKNHLETMLNRLRDRPSPITLAEFQAKRNQIVEAAQLNILSAMLLIGDNLRAAEPATAAHWFSMAADQGDPIGLVQYGLMLRKGQGVEKSDPETAFSLFQKAADKDDVNGKYELGACYLHGFGTPVDEKRAVELLREVAKDGDNRAMDILGYCYDHAAGVPKDLKVAFDYYSQAAEKGDYEAVGNMGIHYFNGDGVKKDRIKAAELFKSGAEKGNPYCMQLYAQVLEEGIGVGKNPYEARQLYIRAAIAGNEKAAQWCKEHSIPYNK